MIEKVKALLETDGAFLLSFSVLLVCVLIIACLTLKSKHKRACSETETLKAKLDSSEKLIKSRSVEVENYKRYYIKYKDIPDAEAHISNMEAEMRSSLKELDDRVSTQKNLVEELQQKKERLMDLCAKLEKQAQSNENKINKYKPMINSMKYAIDFFYNCSDNEFRDINIEAFEYTWPSEEVELKCLSMKSLRKLFKDNEKNISAIVKEYQAQYTTKANATIYSLMVMVLNAELTNILSTLSYGKLESAIEKVKEMTGRYHAIAISGNQTIAGTMHRFIGQMEHFFIKAVEIEYEYYIQRERAKEEQRAIREQMRQENEERKKLEAERKQVEAEEKKYHNEIERVQNMIDVSNDQDEIQVLKARIAELDAQLLAVSEKKEEIITLQNGKAGTVYVISNLGSFGENVFKVGMTRRLDPQDRVTELGDASVPFPFDVHSFIFSDDAVALESALHNELNDKRLNKVNLRKEFFNVSLDEIEALVAKHDPSAPFTRTMLAEQYKQSLSIDIPSDEQLDILDDGEKDII